MTVKIVVYSNSDELVAEIGKAVYLWHGRMTVTPVEPEEITARMPERRREVTKQKRSLPWRTYDYIVKSIRDMRDVPLSNRSITHAQLVTIFEEKGFAGSSIESAAQTLIRCGGYMNRIGPSEFGPGPNFKRFKLRKTKLPGAEYRPRGSTANYNGTNDVRTSS